MMTWLCYDKFSFLGSLCNVRITTRDWAHLKAGNVRNRMVMEFLNVKKKELLEKRQKRFIGL